MTLRVLDIHIMTLWQQISYWPVRYPLKTRGPKGHCRSPENNERIKNWLRNLDDCYTFGLLLSHPVWRNIFLKKPPPVTYFRLALDPPFGRSGQNTLMHVRCHEHFIPTKFHKHPSSSSRSVVRADFVFWYINMH